MASKYPIHTGIQHQVIQDSVPYGLPFVDEHNQTLTILPNYIKQNFKTLYKIH